ncbi:VOC family protein [Microbacterium schleiferi]|uniref:VOC family protein n=1 Tax=Microbacterium schleiferi TaxID=69362 RepID=UPI00311F026D
MGFYRVLGWEPHPGSVPGVVAFHQLDGSAFALWSRAELAADSMVDDAGGWGGVTLAHNVRSPADVDSILSAAVAAGARLGRPGAATPWGGYSGVFIDPMVIRGRWHTIPAGRSTAPAASPSDHSRQAASG